MEIRKKIKDTLFDNTDLEMANKEIGYLKDLYDKDQMVIGYQKELLNIQSESIKEMRLQLTRFEDLKKDLEELKNGTKVTRAKHNIRNKD